MTLLLNGWAGDNAGNVIGREPNTLLVALTASDPTEIPPRGLTERGGDLPGGVHVYPYCQVACLTPNSRFAFVTNITPRGTFLYAIELMEVDLSYMGLPRDPWRPGVHLFSVELQDEANPFNLSTTIATAVIDDKVPRLEDMEPKYLEAVTRAAFPGRRLGGP